MKLSPKRQPGSGETAHLYDMLDPELRFGRVYKGSRLSRYHTIHNGSSFLVRVGTSHDELSPGLKHAIENHESIPEEMRTRGFRFLLAHGVEDPKAEDGVGYRGCTDDPRYYYSVECIGDVPRGAVVGVAQQRVVAGLANAVHRTLKAEQELTRKLDGPKDLEV